MLTSALMVVELDKDGFTRRPCRVCFPEFPVLRVLHRLCDQCGHSKPTPCSHNGGVQVLVSHSGEEHRRMVWPEEAYRYQLAPLSIRV